MNWKEIKLAALQKMFSAEGGGINQSDSGVWEYLAAMPQAANEAVQRLCAAGFAPRKSCRLQKLPGRVQTLDLAGLAPDLLRAEPLELYRFDAAGTPNPVDGAVLAAGRYLVLPAGVNGTLELFYEARPPLLSAAAPDETEIAMADGAEVLIPLYIASQLYKDDDAGIATQYRNEFEAALTAPRPDKAGLQGGEFISARAWC